jgi:hypothetical protein
MKSWNIPLLAVTVLFTLAVCSILVAAAWKYIHPFAGGVVAGLLVEALALVVVVLKKHGYV